MYLTKVTIPNTVTTIGDYAFAGSGLAGTLTIPDSVLTIGQGAFENTKISQLTLGDGIKTIGIAAFMYCGNLTGTAGFKWADTLTIPSSVTGLGMNAFWGTKITGLWMYGKPPAILFFSGSSGTGSNPAGFPASMIYPALRIIVPASSRSAYQSAAYWSSYKSGIYADNDSRLKAA
jgi:hypothetical protein